MSNELTNWHMHQALFRPCPIQVMRYKLGYTQADLAKDARVGHNTVSIAESGTTRLTPESLKKIAYALAGRSANDRDELTEAYLTWYNERRDAAFYLAEPAEKSLDGEMNVD